MRMIATGLLLVLFSAGHVFGQDESVSNSVFLALPSGGICATASYLDHITMNVIIACPTLAAASGFEAGLVIENQVNTSLTVQYPVPCFFCDPPQQGPGFYRLQAPLDPPVPLTEQTIIAEIDIFYLDSGPLYFHLVGGRPSSIDADLPAYLGNDPDSTLWPLFPLPTGQSYDFAINDPECGSPARTGITCGSIADQQLSWGQVKSLYRH